MKNIFSSNICTGKIALNSQYAVPVNNLVNRIKVLFGQEYTELFFWSYRVNGTVGHSIELDNADGTISYTLTLTEADEICFSKYSFISDEGEITVLDSADAMGMIHYILYKLPNVHLVSFPEIFNS
ncbi:hypothetical protein [Phocoenobacter skyensis]|uniref:hypothetical protein n=1 Tax=Phocoenobacter skyensis TaxID=97481 RepID=UPI002767A361|nr:hypothetical protein [Pasteurella skyensis]MDP8185292.1 hypothetical protein [Pasteurella skyensis]